MRGYRGLGLQPLGVFFFLGQPVIFALLVSHPNSRMGIQRFDVLAGPLAEFRVFFDRLFGGIYLLKVIAHARLYLSRYSPLFCVDLPHQPRAGRDDLIVDTFRRWSIAVHGLTAVIDPAVMIGAGDRIEA